jgi:hypothetical protein
VRFHSDGRSLADLSETGTPTDCRPDPWVRQTAHMALFGRRQRDTRQAITTFWAWWARARGQVAVGLDQDDLGKMHRVLTDRVRTIHPELAWELTTGRSARRALVISPEGSPALRPVTERWLRAGPPPDADWEYYPARQPDPAVYGRSVQLSGRPFTPGSARFGIETDAERARVHVRVWHPDFEQLDDAVRLQASFLLLDWALGEDDVERWLGEVTVVREQQPDDVAGLRAGVEELAKRFGHGDWLSVEGLDERDRPVSVRVKVPFPRRDHPLFDLHGRVRVPFEPDTGDELRLDEVQAGLLGRLGGSVALVAVVTRAGARTMHLYADSAGVVPDQVAAWAGQQSRPVSQEWRADPGWEAVRGLY